MSQMVFELKGSIQGHLLSCMFLDKTSNEYRKNTRQSIIYSCMLSVIVTDSNFNMALAVSIAQNQSMYLIVVPDVLWV